MQARRRLLSLRKRKRKEKRRGKEKADDHRSARSSPSPLLIKGDTICNPPASTCRKKRKRGRKKKKMPSCVLPLRKATSRRVLKREGGEKGKEKEGKKIPGRPLLHRRPVIISHLPPGYVEKRKRKERKKKRKIRVRTSTASFNILSEERKLLVSEVERDGERERKRKKKKSLHSIFLILLPQRRRASDCECRPHSRKGGEGKKRKEENCSHLFF